MHCRRTPNVATEMKPFITLASVAIFAPATIAFTGSAEEGPEGNDIVEILTSTATDEDGFDPTTAMLMTDDGFASMPLFASDQVQPILDFAASHLGRPYRGGGKGPSVFDCSGFTSYVFGKFGYSLSPSSSMQYTQGTPIDIRLVQPGDLLFFSGRRISSSRVGHVGMVTDVDYETGSVRFIHAAVGGGIRYDTYPDDAYYSKRFIGARRILTDAGEETPTDDNKLNQQSPNSK